jgi:acetyl/propionyl-CoA carboxylase alpha subunit
MADDQDFLARLAGGELRELLRLLDGSDIEELELEVSGTKLVFKRSVAEETSSRVDTAGIEQQTDWRAPIFVVAERVGFFHQPDGAGRPRAGDSVSADQVLGVIDSLNVPSPVQAPCSGVLDEVLVEEGQPVEYGQPLFVLHPVES